MLVYLRCRRSALLLLAFSVFLAAQTNTVHLAGETGRQHASGTGEPLDIFGPGVVIADPYGSIYVAVRDGIYKVDTGGARTRIAGVGRRSRYSGDGGPAIDSGMNPRGLAVDRAGNLYFADAGNNRVRKLDRASGVVTTIAGNGVSGFSGDGGAAVAASLDGPTGVALDPAGNLYISDGSTHGHNRIRKVDAGTGVIMTFAGNGLQGFSGDGGLATQAQFHSLGGLATDASGNLYIADNYNNRIRMVSAATGTISTVAGNGSAGLEGDGGRAVDAELNNPLSVAVDADGDLFIADAQNFRIRRVNLATGAIATTSDTRVYRDSQHGFPCALAVDAAGDLYVADSGNSQIRRIPAGVAHESADPPAVHPMLAPSSAFKINVTYDSSVPAAAQTAFNNLIATYESLFTTNITVNVSVFFGTTGLGQSETAEVFESYHNWRNAMLANATANPGNSYAAAAAAGLPASDPIGNGTVVLTTANARALGFSANASVDTTLTFSNAAAFEYTGTVTPSTIDFLDTSAHELDEGLAIGSALTGLQDNAALPGGDYAAEDYFRYSAVGTRGISTSPTAVVYFSYDGGTTNVAQFNQAYAAEGDSDLDRNDWIYGNSGCPSAKVYIQDAIACYGQSAPIGVGPEIIVFKSMGFNSSTSQTITFGALSNVTVGVAPFSISATASSGLTVTFTSTTTSVCSVSGTTVTILATGPCSITASQAGNATYAAATPVTQSFTVNPLLAPTLLSPANGAAGVSQLPTLEWNASSGATSYDVYFGTAASPPLVTNVTATGYAPTGLSANSTYHWKIVARNSLATASSSTFAFSTYNSSCTFAVSPTAVPITYTGGSSSVSVTAGSGCAWTASSNASWLTVTSASGTGNGMISFTATANAGTAQLATISFANTSFKVMEGGSPSAPIFNDVASSDPYFDYVSLMSNYGITVGCQTSPPLYCPSQPVTRAEMAVFIVRGVNLATGASLTYPTTAYFQDVPSSGVPDSEYFPYVQRLAQLAITVGCQTSPVALFCPDESIPQAQMAVFVIRAWMLSNNITTLTYPTTPYFTDVPATDEYFPYIQKMAQLVFWMGCGGGQYCENSAVTRDQMAPMITRGMLGAP
jgi:sugar lactone lactonase YvrE